MSEHSKTEFDDLNRELSGADTTKATRFLGDFGVSGNKAESKEAKARREFLSQLDLLLQDPIYRAAYEQTMRKIDDVQDKLNSAFEKLAKRIEHLEDVIDDLEGKAPKLDDGTAIFKDKNGNVRTADGRHIENGNLPASLLILLDTSPSYEQYEGTRDALSGARHNQDKLSGIQDKVDDARDRMKEGPKDLDAVDDIQKEMEDALEDIDAKYSAKTDFERASTMEPENLALDRAEHQNHLNLLPSQ